jgi:sulfate adenylyltransferase subunit 1 (EFTu-like GTPase family)
LAENTNNMKIEQGKSYLAKVEGQLIELEVEQITPKSNFRVKTHHHKKWYDFWEIYRIVVEQL